MCIILSCAPNARPSRELLRTCWTNNPDGGGVMYEDGGAVHVSKGYMTFEDMAAAVEDAPLKSHLIIHMRIGTSGGLGPEVTHPYPVTDDLDALHALELTCPVGIAHNGVLPYPSDEANGISDTVAYIATEVTKIDRMRRVRSGGGLAVSPKARAMLKATSEGSRLAILDRNGNVRLTGDGWQGVACGIQASNGSWRSCRLAPAAWDPWDWGEPDGAPEPGTIALCELMESWGCDGCECFGRCLECGTMCGLEEMAA